jgi:hypothetical protein
MSQFNSTADLGAIFRGLDQRLSALERTKVTHGSGAPPTGATEPYVQDDVTKLWLKPAGLWKSTTLT